MDKKKIVLSNIFEVEPLVCLKTGEILMVYGPPEDLWRWAKNSPMICFDPCSTKCRSVRLRKGLEKIRLDE